MPARTSASVTEVTKRSRGGRAFNQATTAGSGLGRMSSETTFVSRITIAAAVSVESRRLAHRLAWRDTQVRATQWRKQFHERAAQPIRR